MDNSISKIAEQRILEALEQGEFDNLPGQGKPLEKDDDSRVPEDLRMAYKILKNSGHVPKEVEIQREIRVTEDLLADLKDEKERLRALKRLGVLRDKMNTSMGRPINIEADEAYYAKVVEKLDRNKK